MVSYYDGYDNCTRHLLPMHRAVTVIEWLKNTTLIMIMTYLSLNAFEATAAQAVTKGIGGSIRYKVGCIISKEGLFCVLRLKFDE